MAYARYLARHADCRLQLANAVTTGMTAQAEEGLSRRGYINAAGCVCSGTDNSKSTDLLAAHLLPSTGVRSLLCCRISAVATTPRVALILL